MKLTAKFQPIEIGEECDDGQIREILRGWFKKTVSDHSRQRDLDFIDLLRWFADRCEQYTIDSPSEFRALLAKLDNVREEMERDKLK